MLELFTNPGFLAAGGALVSAPIIIHLINRMRFKRLKWAAMEFLLKSQKRNRRRLIIEQLLLLALRCLLVALTTLLVARFAGFSFGSNQAKEITHIALLDDTLSMSDQWKEGDGAKDCFQVARAEVDKIARNLGASTRNDRLALIVLSKIAVEPGYVPKVYSRLNDKGKMDEFKSDLDQLQPTKLHVDILPGLKKVQQIMKNNPQGRVNLHIVSDFRQSDWGLPQGEALKNELLQIAKTPDVEVVLVDTVHPYRQVGPSGMPGGIPMSHDNIGLIDLRAGTRVVGKGMPVVLTATVANYSSREARVNLAVFDDKSGKERHEVDFQPPMPLKVPAGATASASCVLRFDPDIKARETYFAPISVHLEDAQRGVLPNDGLKEDNVRYTAIEVRNKVPVLVIDGEGARGRNENQDSFFIKNAIISVPGASYEVVYGDELGGGVAAKALERADLTQYPTIFMLNVRELNPKQLANLTNYIKEGGGVAFFMGPLVSPDFYNKKLYADGKGIFPVKLKEETYYPPPKDDPRKPQYSANDYQVLLRDTEYPDIDLYPIFGPIFKEPKIRELLKDLPVGRYFKASRPKAQQTEASRVQELVTLPLDESVSKSVGPVLAIFDGLDKILKNDEYKPYVRALQRYRRTIMDLVAPGSDKKPQHLAAALDEMLADKGKEKDRKDYPNLTEFWTNSDPKIRTLREDILKLRDQVLYGDPFIVASTYGNGKVVAVMTTAGKEWNDWGGGSNSSLLFQPFIWELQNHLSSQASDAFLRVGTPVQVRVDSEQYKQKNRQLQVVRYFMKAQQDKPAQKIEDTKQFGEGKKGELVFNFDKNLEPGLYEAHLVYEDQTGSTPLTSWGHVFNVDTQREGKLLRVSGEDLEKNLLREAAGKIKIESPQSNPDDEAQARNDLSESPWFFLFFLAILVAEQALAVHLSFHLRGGEAELPAAAAAPRASAA